MSVRTRWRQFEEWGNTHVLVISLIFVCIVSIGGFVSFQIYNHNAVVRAKAQAVHEAKERSDQVAASSLDVCKRVVTVVTDQLNADLLKVVKTVEDRFTEQGRPVPGIYLHLEAVLTNRQPPVGACEPKENN